MSDTKDKALGVLDTLYTEKHITGEEYAALAAGIQEGAPVGDSAMVYTAFLVDGCFADANDPLVDSLMFEHVDAVELGALLRLSMRHNFDIVVRRQYEDNDE